MRATRSHLFAHLGMNGVCEVPDEDRGRVHAAGRLDALRERRGLRGRDRDDALAVGQPVERGHHAALAVHQVSERLVLLQINEFLVFKEGRSCFEEVAIQRKCDLIEGRIAGVPRDKTDGLTL